MIDATKAAVLAQASAPERFVVDIDQVRETRCGWYFPWRFDGPPQAGSKGVIVDKQSGRVVTLGSAFLVVTAVRNERRAIDHLLRLRIKEVTPEFAHGVQWKIPKAVTAQVIESRLRQLPCKFGPIATYFAIEALEAMRRGGDISYQLEEVSS